MKRLALNTAIVLSTLAAMAILWQLRGAILIFFLSLATAAALRPRVQNLMDRGLPKSVSLGITYFIVIATITAMILLLAAPVGVEMQKIGDDFLHAYDRISERWPERSAMEQSIARRLPPPQEILNSILGEENTTVGQLVLGVTLGFFGLVVNLIVVLVLSIYWSIDRAHFERLWLSLMSADLRTEARDVWRAIETEVGAYLRSEVVQSFFAGVLLGIGYWLIGLPYPFLLGIVGALAWFVPWVGMLVALTAVGVLSLPTLVLNPEPRAVFVFVGACGYTLLVLMLLEIWIEPQLFNRRRYNSLLIAVVVISLAEMIGVFGIVLGPPLAAALQILLGHLLRRRATATVVEGAASSQSLHERVQAVRSRLAALAEPPPELLSLSDRLFKLVNDAEQLGPASGRYADTTLPADTSPAAG